MSLLEKLKEKRKKISVSEGKELYKVFSNESLEATARARPRNRDDLRNIKGWGPKKIEKYAEDFLLIINEETEGKQDVPDSPLSPDQDHVFSVSDYLDLLNVGLRKSEARVKGEVSSVEVRERYIFFSIKDEKKESLLNCFVWQGDYRLSGLKIEEGMEVIVWGYPNVYKPSGRLTFQVRSLELVGEGALKKAYEELKKKLSHEGLFSPERKKPIPRFPGKIGLITSKEGAVIHDFLNNLGKFGFKIIFKNSRVEGQRAVKELVGSVDYFKDKDVDVLVIIRGGGSLESLLPFNNEILARKLADSPVPVLVGIGHDRDIPLASMVADLAVSTPTAVTKILNGSWEEAVNSLEFLKKSTFSYFERFLLKYEKELSGSSSFLKDEVERFFEAFRRTERNFLNSVSRLDFILKDKRKELTKKAEFFFGRFKEFMVRTADKVASMEASIKTGDPERNLKLGYSITYLKGKIIRSVDVVGLGDDVEIKLKDGIINSKVSKKIKKQTE